jgi:hypothetical protein
MVRASRRKDSFLLGSFHAHMQHFDGRWPF